MAEPSPTSANVTDYPDPPEEKAHRFWEHTLRDHADRETWKLTAETDPDACVRFELEHFASGISTVLELDPSDVEAVLGLFTLAWCGLSEYPLGPGRPSRDLQEQHTELTARTKRLIETLNRLRNEQVLERERTRTFEDQDPHTVADTLLGEKCTRCAGCGQIANDEDGTPWIAWAELPPGSRLAVDAGIVSPVTCPACHGNGRRP